MSSITSNEYVNFTLAIHSPQSPPSDVLSRTETPPSCASAMDGRDASTLGYSSSQPNTENFNAFANRKSANITAQNLYLLDGLANPNISGTLRPHPSQLDLKYCNPNCKTFYIVTTGWEVGIFDNWGIARTRIETVHNNSYKSFPSWKEAVLYYTQCHNESCIEIRNPKSLSLTPTPATRNKRRRNVGKLTDVDMVTPQPPASTPMPPNPAQPQGTLWAATPTAVVQLPFHSGTHGIGTASRPITVSPATLNPSSPAPIVKKTDKAQPSTSESTKGKGKQRSTSKKGERKELAKLEEVIVISSESEDKETKSTPAAKHGPSPPPVVIGRRCHVVIIDDDGVEVEELGTAANQSKKIRRYSIAVHTTTVKNPIPRKTNSKTVPLPVQLFNLAINKCEGGVTGPSGTITVPSSSRRFSTQRNAERNPQLEDSEYEFSDIETEVLAALCDTPMADA